MKPENIWAYGLLEDVIRDAVRKADGKKPTIQVYAAVLQMIDLARLVRKEGMLALNNAAGDLQTELAAISILPMGIDYITSGLDSDLTAETLTARYWTKNPQGMEALAFCICIRGLMEIQYDRYSPYELEILLTAFLSEECRAGYEAYKEEKDSVSEPESPKKKLEKTYLKLGTKGSILRNALEERLAQAPDNTIKEVIQKMGDQQQMLVLAIQGLSNAGRERVFSCMSGIRAGSIYEDIEYMGPVRTVDIEDAFVCLIDCIEDVSGK